MLRTYVELQQRFTEFKNGVAAEDGTTVPEYMLVLGFISLIIVVAFSTSGVANSITAMGTNLAGTINP